LLSGIFLRTVVTFAIEIARFTDAKVKGCNDQTYCYSHESWLKIIDLATAVWYESLYHLNRNRSNEGNAAAYR